MVKKNQKKGKKTTKGNKVSMIDDDDQVMVEPSLHDHLGLFRSFLII